MNAVVRWWNSALKPDGRILISYLIIVMIAAAFVALASVVSTGGTLAIDRLLIAGLRDPADSSLSIGPRWFRSLMLSMTAWGNIASLAVLTVIIAGYLLVVRKAATAAFLVSAVAGGELVSGLLKAMFNRSRPDVVAHLVEVQTTSFPSGHAMNSAVVFLTLGALLSRVHSQQRVRAYILTVAILLTLTIGFSRVYLGVHWPSDVLAGWMVGGVWATLCWMLARRLQRQKTLEPASPPG
jgi:undecaprenyl-diphosphatase